MLIRYKACFGKKDPYTTVDWEKRQVDVYSHNGREKKVLLVEAPKHWSDNAVKIAAGKYFYGTEETSIRQMIHRVSSTLGQWAVDYGYMTPGNARQFADDLAYLCLHQMGSFNSPVWFNVGIKETKAPSQYNWWFNPKTQKAEPADTRIHPQCSACFIQSVKDNLGSIMDLAKSEAVLFKYGSGTGTDLTPLRSSMERLTGGGLASGPVSYLAIYDQVAGSIRSGGKTRRSAKMNTLRDWHPDILQFIECKAHEELKAKALIQMGFDGSLNGDAYGTVKFQNGNLSVRVSDEFMEAAQQKKPWTTREVTTGKPVTTYNASDLLDKIAWGTWVCGDPGLQFDEAIQKWHTCKDTSPIHSSNPCSEYLFLNDTACNLASLNLLRFLDPQGHLDIPRFQAAIRTFILAQDIIVSASCYPTPEIAENSHRFRTLGLGFCNLGGLLMTLGIPYHSEAGCYLASCITTLMTATAYQVSAELAKALGSFPGWSDARCAGVDKPLKHDNKESMLEVLHQHKAATEKLRSGPLPSMLPVVDTALLTWKSVLRANRGYRNAQVTVIAPTGTISFIMDSDTTGIEPELALVKTKYLTDGGQIRLCNQLVAKALQKLGYTETEIQRIQAHIQNFETIEDVQLKPEDPLVKEDKFPAGLYVSGLKEEHLPVFDCALPSSHGKRVLPPQAHLNMMAAVQPFISGAISKTVNVPEKTTVEEIRQIYVDAWKMGLKCVAIYRDGSKGAQPLVTQNKKNEPRSGHVPESRELIQAHEGSAQSAARRHLPSTRSALTHKFNVGGVDGYITVGLFPDGSPGEMFAVVSKEGSTIGGLMDTIATLTSLALQYNVPLEVLVNKFAYQRFEPSGITNNPNIRFANSIVDYIFRWMEDTFLTYKKGAVTPPQLNLPCLEDNMEPGEPKQAPRESRKNQVSGITCRDCGAVMHQSGTCFCCPQCGTTSGCS